MSVKQSHLLVVVVTAAVRKEKMFVCVPLLFYHQIISK